MGLVIALKAAAAQRVPLKLVTVPVIQCIHPHLLNEMTEPASQFIIQYIVTFCNASSFGGLYQIVSPRRHYIERIFWGGIVALSATCAFLLVTSSYERYQTNPTVISMDKNYMKWETPLPAATFCFDQQYYLAKGRDFIQRTWNVTAGTKFEYYNEFLKCLSNGIYESSGTNLCSSYSKDSNLDKFDIANLIELTYYNASEILAITFEGDEDIGIHTTLAENGICYSTNISILTKYFTILQDIPLDSTKSQLKKDMQSSDFLNKAKSCTYFTPLCYAKIMNLRRTALFYVHGPYDVPMLFGGLATSLSNETYADFLSQTIEASPSIRKLRPSQRKCVFHDESTEDMPYYTYNLCIRGCRTELSVKLCGCVGYPYRARGNQRTCTVKDLACLYENTDVFEDLRFGNGTVYKCNCMPDCSSVTYYKTSLQLIVGSQTNEKTSGKTAFRYGLESMPRTRLVRDVLFAMEDLLVSWGGIVGLFLGCSIISVFEAVYFFTIRLIRVLLLKKLQREPVEDVVLKRHNRNWFRPYVMGHTGRHAYDD